MRGTTKPTTISRIYIEIQTCIEIHFNTDSPPLPPSLQFITQNKIIT